MLRAIDLQAGYRRGVPVLHGIDLAVAAGGALGVIGRNGAGKTCLAQTLTGALPVIDGQVLLGGDDVSGSDSRARVRARLSHVPEGRMIFADLTVRENLEVAAYGAGVKLTAQAAARRRAALPDPRAQGARPRRLAQRRRAAVAGDRTGARAAAARDRARRAVAGALAGRDRRRRRRRSWGFARPASR